MTDTRRIICQKKKRAVLKVTDDPTLKTCVRERGTETEEGGGVHNLSTLFGNEKVSPERYYFKKTKNKLLNVSDPFSQLPIKRE